MHIHLRANHRHCRELNSESFPLTLLYVCRRWCNLDTLPCVLSAEQQQTVEARLRDVVSALPAGLRGAHITTPFSDPKYMRMHDWFILASPIGE